VLSLHTQFHADIVLLEGGGERCCVVLLYVLCCSLHFYLLYSSHNILLTSTLLMAKTDKKKGKATKAATAEVGKSVTHHVQGDQKVVKKMKKKDVGQPPPNVRGRPNILIEDALDALCDARLECHEAVKEDPTRHDFFDCVQLGDPSSKQMKCADCMFDLQFNEYLYGKPNEHENPLQTVMICLQCSLHWRGPSRYYVCADCSRLYENEGGDDGIVNRHTEIFYVDEPKIIQARK